MNTVILVTDSIDIKKKLQENLVLLRETDKILAVNYENAQDVLYDIRPEIVIVHENENRDKTFKLIKYIKSKKIFDLSSIILYANKFDRDFVLEAYDEGIEDYITDGDDPTGMLIRTINCIKKSGLINKIKNLKNYLGCYGIVDNKTGFYSPKFAREIFEMELLNGNFNNGCYMIIAPDEEGKKEFTEEKIVAAIEETIRIDDTVAKISSFRYGILLKTGVDGAINVLNKIKALLPYKCTIKAGITMIDSKKFQEIEKKAVCSLNNALLTNRDYSIYSGDDMENDDWLSIPDKGEKNYKFFKKAFDQKLEKVIAPVFYRLQKSYEEKLSGVRIEQFTDEQQSIFRLIKGKNESRLTIVSPGFSKIIVYIVHSGLDSPENREISLPLNVVTPQKISELVEGFINEFMCVYTSN